MDGSVYTEVLYMYVKTLSITLILLKSNEEYNELIIL
jgi:hypothetical protein